MDKHTAINNDFINMFGLTYAQTQLLFSTQKLIAEYDIKHDFSIKERSEKKKWLKLWEKEIVATFGNNFSNNFFISKETINVNYQDEIKRNHSLTWYYILMLECITFRPYFAFNDNKIKKLKFDEKYCNEKTKAFFVKQGKVSEDAFVRLKKTYDDSIKHISGKTGKILAISVSSVLVFTGIIATCFAIKSPDIATKLFGDKFKGLNGIALKNACLSFVGGGSIFHGGGGLERGTAIIAGGGALLGIASGGSVAMGISIPLIVASPEYTLTQSAKLETILKEVILNTQQDIVSAQMIIERLKCQIAELNQRIVDLEAEDKKNKNELKDINRSLKYLKKANKDMNRFSSSYEEGYKIQQKQNSKVSD